MKKKKHIVLISVIIILIILIIILSKFVINNNNQNKNFSLIGGLKADEVCATALEPLYVNGKKVCEFSCILSDTYSIRLFNGKEYKIKEALEKGIVTIEQLQEKGLPCR